MQLDKTYSFNPLSLILNIAHLLIIFLLIALLIYAHYIGINTESQSIILNIIKIYKILIYYQSVRSHNRKVVPMNT